MKTKFDELIAKYLDGTLQEGDKQLLAMMLRDPENQLYLASKMDEQFFDQSLEEIGDEKTGNQIFEGIQRKLKEELLPEQEGLVIQMPWYRKKAVRFISVAASVIFLIGLGIVFINNNKTDRQSIVIKKVDKIDSSTVAFVHEINSTGKEKRIQLSDGSLILLADKSEISYPKAFTDKRDITLIGKAYFKVAKDKTRPFSVISGDISTTALGTEFTVTALKNSKYIIVRLYEGKVVVKALDTGNKRMKNDVYLLPGQELVYGGPTVIVKKFRLNKHAGPEQSMKEELSHENPSIPEDTKSSYFMFNNRPLEEVFDQLAEIYKVKIVYNKKDVNNMYFIGKYNNGASVETILKRIATLNNLTITKQDNAFIISK